ncbi:MAG: nucleotide exchange factor GrpE [Limisphaerales bacterium]
MNNSNLWKTSKWPFLLGDAALLLVAFIFILRAAHPIGSFEIAIATACVALGALLGCLPFILDYRVSVKSIEASALGSIAEKIQNLEKLSAQISSATNEWTNAQSQAEKTAAAARAIADSMAAEVRQFSEFMQRMNDNEKAALRLEVDKFRRGEAEWLQVVVRILDQVFLFHAAAVRSGQPKFADQVSHFQNACCDAARRIGLVPFTANPDEPFDPKRHQNAEGKAEAADGAVVAETIAAGFTFQGKLIRPALVRVKAPASEPEETMEDPEEKSDELSFQEPD